MLGICNMEVSVGLMREMGLIDLYPDMITNVALIKGFCDANQLEDACGLFKVMRGHGCLPNTVAYSALLNGVCRFGNVERALELLREMETECGDCNPNVVTYTSIIQSFCEKGQSMEALGILDQMVACGFAPNRVTIINLIKGLCTEGRVEEAYKLPLNDQSFQNKSFWLPRDAGCLTDGEMSYDGSLRIEQKRAHQWFMDSSEPKLFCNKKQAIEAVNSRTLSGISNANISLWENTSSSQSISAQFTDRLFGYESGRTFNRPLW